MFDFPVIGIALVPATQGLSVLRDLRVIPMLSSLRRVVEGFLHV
ncbi:MAG: ion transporter, partial [Candidatus Saccharibacteria bacterium]|nr:ion transporter [Pseudorhodobacter sp.]